MISFLPTATLREGEAASRIAAHAQGGGAVVTLLLDEGGDVEVMSDLTPSYTSALLMLTLQELPDGTTH